MPTQQIFISYSVTDKNMAETICAALETSGWNCWMAPRDILPGSDWVESIIDAIGNSGVMVLIYSEASGNSIQIKREIECAANKSVPVITFRIENTPISKSLEYHLSTTYWIDALMPRLELHLRLLNEVVEKIIGTPAADKISGRKTAAERMAIGDMRRNKSGRKFFRLQTRFAKIAAIIALLIFLGGGAYLGIARPWEDHRSFDSLRNQCQQYINERQFDRAIEECKKAVEKEPLNSLSHRALGVAYHARGMEFGLASDWPLAVASLNEAIRLDPRDAHALYMRGLVYIAKADYQNSLADFTAALAQEIPSEQRKSELYYNSGIAYAGMKKYELSLENLNRAIELYRHPNIYLALNKTLFEMKKYREAAERLTEAIEHHPNFNGLYIFYGERGNAYSKLNMDKEALKDFQTSRALQQQAQSQAQSEAASR